MSVRFASLTLLISLAVSGCVVSAHSGHHYPKHHPKPVVVMKPYHYPKHHGHHAYPSHRYYGHHGHEGHYGHHRDRGHHRGHHH